VEICVAVVILTLALATYLACPRNTASRVVVATFASFIAYVGLTI
jgi:hypothetical protein